MTTERYTLIREVGEGGLGKVWLARDNDLAREVAIKEIKPGTESSQAARRLIREAQITGQLQHPNIVPVYEVNRGGRPFYAMKLVKGETLSEAIQRHHAQRRAGQTDPLSLSRLLNAFVSVCDALAYAHSRGVIHRDLKPQNIVLGEYGEVIVLDWGLAKVIGEPDDAAAPIALSSDAQADRTRDGATLGTPAYMAPEQAAGRLDLIDARTDIYGLGAILFEILTDQPPFFGAEITELLNRIIADETPRVREWEDAPTALDAICAKAMSKRQDDRYAKATEVARDIQLWLAQVSEDAVRTRRLLYAAHMNLAQSAWEGSQIGRVRELLNAHLPCEDHEDLRGFEWFYWRRLCEWSWLTCRGHTGKVKSVAYSPNGKRLASASEDQTIKVWDAVNGKELLTLRGHSGRVNAVTFSPDGQRLASASLDRTVKLWDSESGREILTLKGHTAPVTNASFSSDGERLVSAASYDKTLKVWNAVSGALLLDIVMDYTTVIHPVVTFSPDSTCVACASLNRKIKLYDAKNGQELLSLGDDSDGSTCVTFSPDGRQIAASSATTKK
ncbi:MAG: serine/threonine protein kinase [Planctomycetia bacterium]|nr:serine/threonine protein kinase [Planctomycetia bacterium]